MPESRPFFKKVAMGGLVALGFATAYSVIEKPNASTTQPPLVNTDESVPSVDEYTTSSGERVIIDNAKSVYRVSHDGENFGRERPLSNLLKLRNGTIDPAEMTDDYQPRRTRAVTSEPDVHIVQFETHPLESYREDLNKLGARVHSYLPENALLVEASPNQLAEVKALPYVRATVPYQPEYKIEAGLDYAVGDGSLSDSRFSIMLLEKGENTMAQVVDEIVSAGGEIHIQNPSTRRLEATLNADQVDLVLSMNQVEFMDLWSAPEHDVDLARIVGGANELETVASYDGSGVRGAVFDGGLFMHEQFDAIPPIVMTNSSNTSHGTPVYGIVFASGDPDPQYRGIIPEAQGIFATYTGLDRPARTAELVDPDGPYRAVFQTSSWGGGRTTAYTTTSAELDQLLFEHDILTLQSQSNAGTRQSRPEAWAKNVVSIGAFNHRNNTDPSDDTWSSTASIGPAEDGRIKPDLSFWYDSTETTSNSAGAYRTFGGTSGATPLTAGYFGLLFEMWADGVFEGTPGLNRNVFDSRPHASTAKALAINTAYQYDFAGTTADMTRVHQGWGRIDQLRAYNMAMSGQIPLIVNEEDVLTPGASSTYTVTSGSGEACDLRATLVFTDLPGSPGASVHAINDLSLRVTTPSGEQYWGNNGLLAGNLSTPGGVSNTIDTVENVFLADVMEGNYTFEVFADAIVADSHVETPTLDADYALVVSGSCMDAPADTDGDGIPNDIDPDDDNDGVLDEDDAFPLDPTETTDTDGDGVGDNSDVYPTDPTEWADSDGDGVGDNADAFPLDPTETTDTDGDGVGDNSDLYPTDPTEWADTDGDGVGDNADAFPLDPTETTDSDGDGVGDNSDLFPTDPTEWADSDGDGVGDNGDVDSDNDGLANIAEFMPGDVQADLLSTDAAIAASLHVQFGVSSKGAFGAAYTTADLPEGYVDVIAEGRAGGKQRFGFIADSGRDGFDGGGYDGDYFLPGTAEEGFTLHIDGTNYSNNERDATADITGNVTEASTDGGVASVTWEGSLPNLGIEKIARVSEEGLFIQLEVILTNTSSADIPNIYFMNNVDPDNDQSLGRGYQTLNTVRSQGDEASNNLSHVTAEQSTSGAGSWNGVEAEGASLAYVSFDSRARVSRGGFSNRDPLAVYNGTGESSGVVGTSVSEDRAISIAFNIGTLAAGESTSFTYYYHFGSPDDLSEIEVFDVGGFRGGDVDEDGVPNFIDLDSDNDSIPDIIEIGLTDANGDYIVDDLALQGSVTTAPDTDGDGIADFLDLESSNPLNDGTAYDIAGTSFAALDTNSDGTINASDIGGGVDINGNGVDDLLETNDSDGDGVPDALDAFPLDPTEWADTDGDGVGDNSDAFPEDPTETTDTDGDGVGDNSDVFPTDPSEWADTDGDGVGDNADAFPSDPTETTDTDGDGVGDNSDLFPTDPSEWADTDGDGVGDNADAFPTDPTETSDSDGDGIGDNSDIDRDNDGIADSAEVLNESTAVLISDWTFTPGMGISTTANSVVYDGAAEFVSKQFNSAAFASLGFTDNYRVSWTLDSFDSGHYSFIGLGLEESNASSPDVDFAFHIDEGTLSIMESGVYIDAYLTIATDAQFAIEVEGTDLRYYVDGTLLRTASIAASSDFYIDSYLPSGAATLSGFTIESLDGSGGATTPNEDVDGDGVLSRFDLDSDNDTIPDVIEAGLVDVDGNFIVDDLTTQGSVTTAPDSDGDLIPDFLDLESLNPANDGTAYDIQTGAYGAEDTNGDGRLDSADTNGGTDANGNGMDDLAEVPVVDSDGDGVPDVIDVFPTDPTEWADTDADGVGDNSDVFPSDPSEWADTDGDGVGDNSDAFPADPTETVDTDGDGVGDNADAFPTDPTETADTDGDGVGDNADLFPSDPTESSDLDGDGIGDNADIDNDNDGIADSAENLVTSSVTEITEWNYESGLGISTTANSVSYDGSAEFTSKQFTSNSFASLGYADNYRVSWTLESFAEGAYFFLGLGLEESGSSSPDVDFAFHLDESVLSILESGAYVETYGVIEAGAEFAIEVAGSELSYYMDGVLLRTVTVTSGSDFYIDSFMPAGAVTFAGFTLDSLDGSGGITANEDVDGDLVLSRFDLDSDNDTIADVIEIGLVDDNGDFLLDDLSLQGSVVTPRDSDSDGIPDFLDLESLNPANDGTAYDIQTGSFSSLDTNGDGQLDSGDVSGGIDANGNGVDDLIE